MSSNQVSSCLEIRFTPHRQAALTAAFILLLATLLPVTAEANSTYPAMYFHRQLRDASDCEMMAGSPTAIAFPASISNPMP